MFLLILIAAWGLLLIPGSAGAEGNIHIGKLRVHPVLLVGETFTDNVFFTYADRQRDSFITYMPGIKLEFPFGRNNAEFEYDVTANRYRINEGENTTDHKAIGLVDLKLGGNFEVRLNGTWIKGNESRAASTSGLIEHFRTNAAGLALIYEMTNRSKVELDYSKSAWDYIESTFRNRDDDLFSGFLYYRFLPKTSAFIEFDRTAASYDTSKDLDNTVNNGWIGLQWRTTEKSRATIKAGAQKKSFDSTLQNYTGAVASLDLAHDFTESVSLALLGQRSAGEPKVEGIRYLLSTAAAAELSVRILRKLYVILRGSYITDKFSDPMPGDAVARQDRTQAAGPGLKFAIRDWLQLEGTYNRRRRTSNIVTHGFTENSYTITAGAVF